MTSCLSMDSIFSLAFYAWTFLCFVHLHIAFKCIAWSSCLCVNRPIWRKCQQNQIKSYRIIRVRLQISMRCQQWPKEQSVNTQQSAITSPTSYYLTHWLVLCANWPLCACPFSLSNSSAYRTWACRGHAPPGPSLYPPLGCCWFCCCLAQQYATSIFTNVHDCITFGYLLLQIRLSTVLCNVRAPYSTGWNFL